MGKKAAGNFPDGNVFFGCARRPGRIGSIGTLLLSIGFTMPAMGADYPVRPITIICYSVGVVGGLWEAWMGIPAGFLAAAINGGVVAYACTRQVRTAYGPS